MGPNLCIGTIFALQYHLIEVANSDDVFGHMVEAFSI